MSSKNFINQFKNTRRQSRVVFKKTEKRRNHGQKKPFSGPQASKKFFGRNGK
jgi:hypothetical protein